MGGGGGDARSSALLSSSRSLFWKQNVSVNVGCLTGRRRGTEPKEEEMRWKNATYYGSDLELALGDTQYMFAFVSGVVTLVGRR